MTGSTGKISSMRLWLKRSMLMTRKCRGSRCRNRKKLLRSKMLSKRSSRGLLSSMMVTLRCGPKCQGWILTQKAQSSKAHNLTDYHQGLNEDLRCKPAYCLKLIWARRKAALRSQSIWIKTSLSRKNSLSSR